MNCNQVELVKNKQVQVIQYPSAHDQEPPVLPLAQLNALRDKFLAYVEIDQDYQESSIKGFQSRTRIFLKWLAENEIQDVSTNHWRDFYASLKKRAKAGELSQTTVRNYFRDVNTFSAWLVKTGHLSYNPLDGITPPTATKDSVHSKAIPREDIDIMIKHAKSTRDRAIFIFFRDTACRGSEAAVMRWEKVNLVEGRAYVVGKGQKLRTLRFKAATTQVLDEYRATLKAYQTTGPVWWGKQGALTYSGIYQIFHRTAERAALIDKNSIPTPGGTPLAAMQPTPECQRPYSRRC